jgi:DNA polymerase (family 10)
LIVVYYNTYVLYSQVLGDPIAIEEPEHLRKDSEMTNREIAAILFNITTILVEQQGNPYRIRAYRRAARNILRAGHSIADRAKAGEPLGIPFLGKRLTAKITQLATEGRCDFYDELCGDLPAAEQTLLKVPGIGPKLAGRVVKDLNTHDPAELVRRAAAAGLKQVWGIGPKRAAAILDGLQIEAPAEKSTVFRDGNVLYVQESFWRDGAATEQFEERSQEHAGHKEAA